MPLLALVFGARGVVHAGRRAQAGHRVQQFQGIDVTADLPGGGRGSEQRSESWLETLLEVGGQRLEGGVAGGQGRSEPAFGPDELGEPAQPVGEGVEAGDSGVL